MSATPLKASREVELKLLVAPGDAARVIPALSALDLSVGEKATTRLRTLYLDTPDLTLAGLGVALRLRDADGNWRLAVKTSGAEPSLDRAAVAARREWECPLPDGTFDPAALDAWGIGALVPDATRAQLAPRFETVVDRETAIVTRADGLVVEVAVDRGMVRAGDAHAPLSEVELELRHGAVAGLFDLALDLHAALPLRLGTENKADLGQRLITGAPPPAVAPPPVGLSRMATVAEALRHGARHAIRHLLANIAPVIDHGDGAAAGLARDATRRARLIMGLARDLTPPDALAALADDRRWLSRRLRDIERWDVVVNHLDVAIAGDALAAGVEAARLDAIMAAARALRARRFTRFALRMARWAEDDGWRRDAPSLTLAALDSPVSDRAAIWLDRATSRLRDASRDHVAGGTGAVSRLAKATVNARSLAELTRGLWPGERTRSFMEAVTALETACQAVRGREWTRVRLARLGGERPDLASAVASVLTWMAEGDGMDRAALAERCAKIADLPVFWRD